MATKKQSTVIFYVLIIVNVFYLCKCYEISEATAVTNLIWRVFPAWADHFQVTVDRSFVTDDGREKFNLNSLPDHLNSSRVNIVSIKGPSGPAAAYAFHYYLKYHLNVHISWSGDQLIPSTGDLATVINETIILQDKHRYYFNVCTFSYSTVWWSWQRWQRELDFMALNGINFALAFTGQEYIWQKLFLHLGLTQNEVDKYFTGAPFLAWNRMANIEKLYGPLSQSFIDGQVTLAKKIHERMKDLGMKRILPGFSGHLPASIRRVYPNATLLRLPNWNNFNDSYSAIYLLDARDPLFVDIGSLFTKMYTEQFGTDHYYNVDIFNEMQPPTSDVSYLTRCGEAVMHSLSKSDPLATWIMQGWLFHNQPEYWRVPQAKALITSVPRGKMIILDLFSESHPQFDRLSGYFGAPFIWCMLNNFGGVSGMFGSLQSINERVHAARVKYHNMVGVGVAPEGIETNDVVYDFMLESPLRDKPVADVSAWIEQFTHRRYGLRHHNVTTAWLIYASTVLNETSGIANHGRYEITSRPSLHLQPIIWYDVDLLEVATGLMYQSATSPHLRSSVTFKYDYVNSVRQWLQVLFSLEYTKFVRAFDARDIKSLQETSERMTKILSDMERLLQTDDHFSLAKWLTSAAEWATSEEERRSYVEGSANQITLWGNEGEIIDYAAKHWSGLMSQYYNKRWQLFFHSIFRCIQLNYTHFDQETFNTRVFEQVEKRFTKSAFIDDIWFYRYPHRSIKPPQPVYSIEKAISLVDSIFENCNLPLGNSREHL